MKIAALVLGVTASVFSILLWIVLVFYNPYASSTADVAGNTFVMLCLPACLAFISSVMYKQYFMLIAFIWSLPISLYLSFTPGIFAWFIAPCIVYFICFLLMIIHRLIEKKTFSLSK